MEIATISIAVLGLLFAAIAAWGAVRAVQLTSQMQQAERQRMLREALIIFQRAALELAQSESPESINQFRAAQFELSRARVNLPRGVSLTTTTLIDRLLDDSAIERPQQAHDQATDASVLLIPPINMPRSARIAAFQLRRLERRFKQQWADDQRQLQMLRDGRQRKKQGLD